MEVELKQDCQNQHNLYIICILSQFSLTIVKTDNKIILASLTSRQTNSFFVIGSSFDMAILLDNNLLLRNSISIIINQKHLSKYIICHFSVTQSSQSHWNNYTLFESSSSTSFSSFLLFRTFHTLTTRLLSSSSSSTSGKSPGFIVAGVDVDFIGANDRANLGLGWISSWHLKQKI